MLSGSDVLKLARWGRLTWTRRRINLSLRWTGCWAPTLSSAPLSDSRVRLPRRFEAVPSGWQGAADRLAFAAFDPENGNGASDAEGIEALYGR